MSASTVSRVLSNPGVVATRTCAISAAGVSCAPSASRCAVMVVK
ncbi:hypothetical protein VB636_03050 [Paracoccus sp. APAP_BH8]